MEKKILPKNKIEKHLQSLFLKSKSENAIDCMMNTYCSTWLVEDLLMKSDKISMSSSVELRAPFLDYRLIEFMSNLSNDHKFSKDNNTTKKILRDITVNLVPKEVLKKKKKGFPIPIYKWLENKSFNQKNLKKNC